jgi:hypothetical protein
VKTQLLGAIALIALTAACGSSDETTSDDDGGGGGGVGGSAGGSEPLPQGLPILGDGTHDIGTVLVTSVATVDDGLNIPTDVKFHPFVAGELWITNRADDSIVVIDNTGLPDRASQKYGGAITPGANHFLANPSGLAFSLDNGNFATSHEEDQVTQSTTPANFMGPTLWPSDRAIFNGGHSGHYDMLHNSPNGMGVAWDSGNAFWIFDGFHSSITRYDFVTDHGPGGADHSDGIVSRCVEGAVARVQGAPTNMEKDQATGWLYIADTGNNRIARLDTATGTDGAPVGPNYDGSVQIRIDGAVMETFIDTSVVGNAWPSGMVLRDGLIFVGDFISSTIFAYDMETREMVDFLPLGLAEGSLTGITFDAEGNLYAADALGNQVLKISAAAQ